MKIKDIQTLQREVMHWADKTFPGQSTASKIKHLSKEAGELLEKPDDRSETADCLLLLLQVAHRQGMTTSLLVEVASAKFEINKARAWGKPDADGICEHQAEPGPNGGNDR
jgi:hypothetical protein